MDDSADQPSPRLALTPLNRPASIPAGSLCLDDQQRVKQVSGFFLNFIRFQAADGTSSRLPDLAPDLSRQLEGPVRRALESGELVTEAFAFSNGADASNAHTCVVTFVPLPSGEQNQVLCTAVELTDPFSSGVSNAMRFERFVTDLSRRFVAASGEQIRVVIDGSVKQLREFLGVDRCSLTTGFTSDLQVAFVSSHARPGVPTFAAGAGVVATLRLPWYIGELTAGRIVRIDHPDDLPPEAREERAYMAESGMQSHVSIPIRVGGLPVCGLGAAWFRGDEHFTEAMVSQMQLVGELIASAMARQRAEREYRRMLDELSHTSRVSTVGQLAAAISHELNQPLCAIMSNAHAAVRLLARTPPSIGAADGAMRDIIADCKRADAVVRAAQDLLRRRESDHQAVQLNDVVRDVLLILHSTAVTRRIQLESHLDPDLPDVRGDRVQLQQVVLNLALNAMDAIRGERRQVELTTSRSGQGVALTVSDSGIGLPDGAVDQVFQPFFTTKAQGLGLGLPLARDIAIAHDGTLRLLETSSQGSRFILELPACHRSDSAEGLAVLDGTKG
jgi:signal transduction histidine kinase